MPTSRHRKSHKQKKTQRRSELELKRHKTQVFAKQISDMLKQHKEDEANKPITAQMPLAPGLTPLPAQEIFPNNFSII